MGRGEDASGPANLDTSILLSQLGFTRSGNYHYNYVDDTLINQSSYGNFWSHTPNGKTSAYRLLFGSTYLAPRASYYRGYGMALRCLAR